MTAVSEQILLVEDEAQIRQFLRVSLEAQGYGVQETRLATDALRICAETDLRLVILDLGLPDLDGQQFLIRLREWSEVPVIVLSVRASEADKVRALDAGANDYVTKPFGISELMARIRAVLRASEGRIAAPTVFESGGLSLDLVQREVRVDGVLLHLTPKEYELLRLLVMNRGQIMTHQQILREIWGPAQQHETHYLRVLVGQLRGKLGDEPTRPRFVVTVQGVGYRLAVSMD
ncbi:response regulator [Kineobactrum salinum]|uniref:Response regulator transcription factor n=1 Tax=Kineobactrum salinum TaxID=2708301 RepID=A0A6C0TWS5_9GAMM|nr:response regulator transcription factor [Kineobactrum salinum]QIB64270.1 response regulator transcription factor [Kineobactrum salinum]